ncbi:transposase [Defluviimonas sp. 20V17]|nr:transposase [Allgaiera indica]KDB04577.1 transposase [Defluviimonas sp. 20V17]SDW21465.1 transposase [Allgaiera indica]
MRGEVLGVERRRRWRHEAKLEIVLSVGMGGATLTQVAQRHDVARSQIYGWRRELGKKGLWSPDRGTVFLPVSRGDTAVPEPQEAHSVAVELRSGNGRCLRFDSALEGEALVRLIRAVEAA